jgi:hypothetical protein
VSSVDKVSTVLYHIILSWCLLLLTKSRTVLTLSTEDTKAGWYDKGQCLLCTQQKTSRQDDMIKDNPDFVNNTIISSCLGVFCCWQSQHCPLSYHLAMVSSVVDKVSTVLQQKAGWYDKGQCWLCQQQKTPRQDDMIKDSADFVNNRRHQGRMIL